jgi:hypothetical protein
MPDASNHHGLLKHRQAPGPERTLRSRPLPGWRGIIPVLVLTMTILAACMTASMPGAGQTKTDLAASPAASPALSTLFVVGEVTIGITAAGFQPAYFESAVGRDLTIMVVNRDSVPRTFTIVKLGVRVDVAPGETARIEIERPSLGHYEYTSDVPGGDPVTGAFSVFI